MKLLPCRNCGKYAQEKPVAVWTPDTGTGTVIAFVHCPQCLNRSEPFFAPMVNYPADLAESQNQAMQSAIDDWNYKNKKLRWREVKGTEQARGGGQVADRCQFG